MAPVPGARPPGSCSPHSWPSVWSGLSSRAAGWPSPNTTPCDSSNLVSLSLALAALLPWVGPLRTADKRHAVLRSLAILLLVCALARPTQVSTDPLLQHVVILDRSASIDDGMDAAARLWLENAIEAHTTESSVAASGPLTLIEIGGATRSELALEGLPAESVRRVRIPERFSSLGPALDAAARCIDRGATGAVTLLSDGLATDSGTADGIGDSEGADWAFALEDLRAREIPVDFIELAATPGDLRPVALTLKGSARVGMTAQLTARLVGGGQVVRCRLVGPEGELDRIEGLRVDGETQASLGFEPQRAGFMELALEIDVTGGVDPRPGDLRFERTLCVQDPLRVLYLGERMVQGRERLGELLGSGFQLSSPVGALLPQALADVDLVMLDDRPAGSLTEAFQEALIERVSVGGLGLMAAGGEAAFGPGGYHDQPLETLLPVEFVQKEEKRDPSTTLVVIIDTSGSMGGNRVQLAKEVARLAIRRLLPHDKVGMVEFYGAKRWAVPIQPASNSIEIERALNRLDAGGGTVILPAIEEAYYGLKNVRTRFKHVLILTDGGVETGAFEPLLRRMADDGMNVSTVLIGPDAHSEFLVTLANWGQGRFYSVPNRFNLPEILLKQPASAKLPAYRPGTVNVRARGGPSWLGEVTAENVPPLAGYVETRPRPGAQRVLETEDEAHPVLASWRYGLGRVTAFTTEPTGPGTQPWSDWDGYGEMLARILARTAADSTAAFAYELQREPGGALLVAERRDAAERVSPSAERLLEGASSVELIFEQVAPERFEARIAWDGSQSGTDLRVITGLAGGSRTRLALDSLTPASELQVAPDTRQRLAAVLALTGGSHRPNRRGPGG